MHKFCALLPGLSTEVGHIYHYHLAVQRAVASLGWEYEAFVPRGAKVLGAGWQPVLANDFWDVRKGWGFRWKMLWGNVGPLRRIFRGRAGVVFLEHFELQNLASLVLALLFVKPQFEFWILHRYAYGERHWKTRVYRVVHWLLERRVRVKYWTDSELLAELQGKWFGRRIEVVPIPHTAVGERIRREGPVLFWWPGGSMREDKGLSRVQKFAERLGEERLVVAERGREFFKGDRVMFVPTVLEEKEYRRWMQTVDFVLLPYAEEEYAHRTSGIFVEAVCAGAVPAVSRGTWMAYELEKFGLGELALDWSGVIEPRQIVGMRVGEKFEKMRKAYREFHSEQGFAQTFLKVFNCRIG